MGAVYNLDGNASGAIKAAGAVTKEVEKTDKSFAAAERSAKRFEERLKAQAEKIKESIDPQTKLNRLYKELGEHVKAGRLSIDQATDAGVKYRRELGLAGQAARGLATGNEKAFGAGALAHVSSYVLGLASVGTAISLIKGELAAIAAIDERAAQRIASVAGNEAQLRRVTASDPKRGFILEEAKKIAAENSLPLEDVYREMTASYGASSDADISVSTLRAAARRTRDPASLGETSSGIGFIIQSSRIKDASEAGGFLEQVLAASPIKDAKVPQALAKVVGDYVSVVAGGSEATAGAILSGLSQASADVEGDRSRTGAINLRLQTETFFKANRRKYGLAADQVDTLDERLAFLFDDKNIGAATDFIRSTTFETPVRGGMATLFLNPEHRARFRANRTEMGSREARLAADAAATDWVRGGDVLAADLTNAVVDSAAAMFDLSRADQGILTTENREKIIGLARDALLQTAPLGEYTLFPGLSARGDVFLKTGPSMDREEALSILRNYGQGTTGELAKAFDTMIERLGNINQTQKSKKTTRGE